MTRTIIDGRPDDADPHGDPTAALRVPGGMAAAVDRARSRLVVAGAVLALGFSLVAARLVDVSLAATGAAPDLKAATVASPSVPRADILDRTGRVLATTVPSTSVYADPTKVHDKDAAAEAIAGVLADVSARSIRRKLDRKGRFVWLHRGLSPREHDAVNRLGLPGIAFKTEHRRLYPARSLAAHVVGFTDVDGNGLAGVERELDARLAANEPVDLSLDLRLQGVMHAALSEAMATFRAIAAAGLIQDARTGEILALVSLPDFDPHRAGSAPADARFNRAALGVYELGSTFKIFNSAIALETGVAGLHDLVDARHPIRVGRFSIRDYRPKARWMTLAEVFKHSSNIGSAQLALEIGAYRQEAYLRRFGLLDELPLELPETAKPLPPERWGSLATMTVSFGHGIAVTPLHLTSAVGAMVNGGILVPPTLLKRAPGPVEGARPVVTPETSDAIRRLMWSVVADGTGGRAKAEGYRVGGKTGTAEKPSETGGYATRRVISSFVAGFPIDDPQYIVFSMLDEPQGNESTHGRASGGWVAAPIVGAVIEAMGPILGVAPRPVDDPRVQEALYLAPAPHEATVGAEGDG